MPSLTREVLEGKRKWSVETADCISWLNRLPEGCVDLVFFSPPYEDCRTYGIGFSLKGMEWVNWMRDVVQACARVSSGLVVVNMSSKVRNHRYSCAVEWLVTDLTREDGLVCWPSPYAWVKMEDRDGALPNGIPGSGGRTCQRRDWEPIYCFARPENVPPSWTDNIAFGTTPLGSSFGGEFSNREENGTRVNDPWKKGNRGAGVGPRRPDGSYTRSVIDPEMSKPTFGHNEGGSVKGGHRQVKPAISNPGNVIGMHSWDRPEDESWFRVPVGGGKLGHELAHESHAPMPLGVAERFVRWFAPPNGVVLDPFTGSGTTGHAALKHGRRFIGCDLDKSIIPVAIKRLQQVEGGL